MDRQQGRCSFGSRFGRLAGGAVLLLGLGLAGPGGAAATSLGGAAALHAAAQDGALVESVRARAGGGGAGGGVGRGGRGFVGPRVGGVGGGVAVRRGFVAAPGVGVRRGFVAAPGVRRGFVAGPGVGRGVGVVGVRRGGFVRGYRPWARRAWYGTVIGGITLGTLIYVTSVPAAPAADVCWYWADPSETRGYWDYC
jgi:hypothetical protein